MCIEMAVKTITITEDAYSSLAALKETGESFSDVVRRLTGKHSLLELEGLLTEKEASVLEEAIRKTRKGMKDRLEVVAKELA